jgi:hypothetical protein
MIAKITLEWSIDVKESLQSILERMCSGVSPIAGEPLRFYVQSKSKSGVRHICDLSSFCPNGACSCPKFSQFGLRSKLERGEKMSMASMCEHLRRVHRWQVFVLTYNLKAALERGLHSSVEKLLSLPNE